MQKASKQVSENRELIQEWKKKKQIFVEPHIGILYQSRGREVYYRENDGWTGFEIAGGRWWRGGGEGGP